MTETNAYLCSIAGQDYVDRVSILYHSVELLTDSHLQPDSTSVDCSPKLPLLTRVRGPVLPVSDIRIVHPETREELPTGQVGLMLGRGPQIMKCYYGDESVSLISAVHVHI